MVLAAAAAGVVTLGKSVGAAHAGLAAGAGAAGPEIPKFVKLKITKPLKASFDGGMTWFDGHTTEYDQEDFLVADPAVRPHNEGNAIVFVEPFFNMQVRVGRTNPGPVYIKWEFRDPDPKTSTGTTQVSINVSPEFNKKAKMAAHQAGAGPKVAADDCCVSCPDGSVTLCAQGMACLVCGRMIYCCQSF